MTLTVQDLYFSTWRMIIKACGATFSSIIHDHEVAGLDLNYLLMEVIAEGELRYVKELIEYGVKPEVNRIHIRQAFRDGHVKVLKYLVTHCGDAGLIVQNYLNSIKNPQK